MLMADGRTPKLIDFGPPSQVLPYESGHPANAFQILDTVIGTGPYLPRGFSRVGNAMKYLLSPQVDLHSVCLSLIMFLVPEAPLVDGSYGVSVIGNAEPPVERGPNSSVAWSKELRDRQWYNFDADGVQVDDASAGIHQVSLTMTNITLGARARAAAGRAGNQTPPSFPAIHKVFDAMGPAGVAAVRELLRTLAMTGCNLGITSSRHLVINRVMEAAELALNEAQSAA